MTDLDRKLAEFEPRETDRWALLMPALVIVWAFVCFFAVIVAGLIWGMKLAGWV